MATTYGSFPGVQVTTAGGGITSVAIGDEENLVIFGEADYDRDGTNVQDDGLTADSTDGLDADTTEASVNEPAQINARNESEMQFGEGSPLADAMKEALANGANIEFLYGVAVERTLRQETVAAQTGTLTNTPIVEDEDEVWFDDGGTRLDVRFTYDGSPASPAATDAVNINPHTGEFAADAAPGTDFTIDYRSLDYDTAFGAGEVRNIVTEGETGVYVSLSEDDDVSANLQAEVADLRNSYQLVNALNAAEPNDNEEVTDDSGNVLRYDARYDTANYDTARQSIDSDFFYKFAPVREEDSPKNIMGGVGGLFAGNPIDDPIYNDALNGVGPLEQQLSRSEADDLRDLNIIPIRQAGSTRVKGNISTSTETDWARDFWRRRITDRVILVAKEVGDNIIGQINDEQTRNAARRQIEAQIRGLVDDRLIKPNGGDENNWFVDVYESSTNPDEVKIDVGFTPYGVVKQVDATVTINTR